MSLIDRSVSELFKSFLMVYNLYLSSKELSAPLCIVSKMYFSLNLFRVILILSSGSESIYLLDFRRILSLFRLLTELAFSFDPLCLSNIGSFASPSDCVIIFASKADSWSRVSSDQSDILPSSVLFLG